MKQHNLARMKLSSVTLVTCLSLSRIKKQIRYDNTNNETEMTKPQLITCSRPVWRSC